MFYVYHLKKSLIEAISTFWISSKHSNFFKRDKFDKPLETITNICSEQRLGSSRVVVKMLNNSSMLKILLLL